jgi:hypothetical protein
MSGIMTGDYKSFCKNNIQLNKYTISLIFLVVKTCWTKIEARNLIPSEGNASKEFAK